MRILDKAHLRLRSLFRRESVDAELDAELRFHLDQLTEENLAAGMTPEEAHTAARRTIGGITQFREECRDTRRLNGFEDLWKDLRHAVGVLWRTPAFTVVAILTLALGIGATSAIFSVVYGVLLKPLPFEEPERLAGLYHRGPGLNMAEMNQGPVTYFTYLDNQRSFEGIGAWDGSEVTITGPGEPERVEALAVTDGLLPLLRVRPLLGRFFSAEDDRPRTPRRAVLSYSYWQRRFGGARDVVGQTIEIDSVRVDIAGVLPASFQFLRTKPAVLLPMQLDRAEPKFVSFGFQAVGRLKPGVTFAQANADVARLIPLVEQVPGYASIRLQPDVRPLAQDVIGNTGRILWILFSTVGIVLLIACANVANLFLVRAEARQQELAVRAALGASRGRIARALLSESVILGLAGGAMGLLFAQGAIGLLRWLAPASLPRVQEIAIDPVVLAFTLAASLLSGLLFGLLPAMRLWTPNTTALKESGRRATGSSSRQQTRNTLVVAEIAMALVLLIVSGLMIRTFAALLRVEPGFSHPEAVQTFRINVPPALVADNQQMVRTHQQIAERLRQVPGVVSVGLASAITMDGEHNGNPLFIEHVNVPRGEIPRLRRFRSIAPGFFEAMGNRIVAGRDITWAEMSQSRPIVIVSEKLAREYWREPAEALGKRVRGFIPTWYEIVGVAGDERDDGMNQPATAIVYWPIVNDTYLRRTMAYAVRSSRVGSPGFLRELQQAVWSVNANLPLAAVKTLEEIQADSIAQTSFAMVMLAIAAVVALLLGVVGIYGVLAYMAAQRTREIGIRIALGAQAGDVRRLFLRHGATLAGAGIGLGIAAALGLTRVLSALLFGVGPMDPLTYVAVSVLLGVVALLAAWLPARRASRADPAIAMRAE